MPRNRAELPPFGFTYTPEWAESGFRLSQHCYLQNEPFPAGAEEIRSFFSNLLPEGGARERIASNARLSRSDVFGLLREYGGDCAGAFSILPEELAPAKEAGYKALSDHELRQLIEMRGVVPVNGVGPRSRLSLAGAQAKCPVFINERGQIALPQGAAPSSHILKFASNDYPGLLLNELFMLRLAAAVGLDTVAAELHWLDDEHPYLAVSRYDRIQQNGRLSRLHQQDLAQAQDLMDWAKYENRDDPEISHVSFSSCLEAVREASSVPIIDAQRLLDWQLFNLLTGNADAHAKNASLVQQTYREDLWALAPFYDLVCVRVYPAITHELALSMGGCFDPLALTIDNVNRFAAASGFKSGYVVKRLEAIAERIEMELMPVLEESIEAAGRDDPILDEIVVTIQQLCGYIKNMPH